MRTTGKGTNGEFKCMMNYRRFNRDPATKFQRPYHAPNTPGDWSLVPEPNLCVACYPDTLI